MDAKEISALSPAALRELALTAPRYLSIACTQLAAAKDAVALGDRRLAATHFERAKTSWLRSHEEEATQLARIAAKRRELAERSVEGADGTASSWVRGDEQYRNDLIRSQHGYRR